MGIVAIFFAVELDKAGLPKVTDYLLIAFVAFHFVMHIIFSLHQCSSDMRKDTKGYQNGVGGYPMRAMNGKNGHGHPGLYPDYEDLQKRDAPGAGIRKFLLFVYVLVAAIFAAALILLVIYGNFSNIGN